MSDPVKKAAASPPPKAPLTAALYEKLKAQEAELEKELKPHRDYYEKVMGDPKLAEARRKIKEVNAKLGPVKNELAALARAGGAKGVKAEPGNYKTTGPSE